MHIPENYLSPSTCAVLGAAMVPVWLVAVSKVRRHVPQEKLPLLGIAAALSFLGMMFNVPLPGGTTGHAVGGTLIAILFGPYAACLSVSVALLIQALFFGDGGILAFGANCFNMAFVLPFVGYAVYSLLRKWIRRGSGDLIGAGVGAYLGINAAALCAAIEFGIQPMLFRDAAGNALYCPYGLNLSVPAMMIGHLTIFGLAEVIFTAGVLAFILRTSPSMVLNTSKDTGERKPLYLLLTALVVLVPLGLLADGTAWGEWGADEIAMDASAGSALGYTPAGMTSGFELSTLFPDYTVSGMPDVLGYIVSAVIGVSLLIIVFRLMGGAKKGPVYSR
ncbi:MAG TPA: cobalamin biosynthesis protein CbiM [Erysipelotrichaceae bacterium]|nr:cobalamin biosynthesis protein CbiM [Erysipelotrichaceae bacterium]